MSAEWSDGMCPVCLGSAFVVRGPVMIEAVCCGHCGLRTTKPELYRTYEPEWLACTKALPDDAGLYIVLANGDVAVAMFNNFDSCFYHPRTYNKMHGVEEWDFLPKECYADSISIGSTR